MTIASVLSVLTSVLWSVFLGMTIVTVVLAVAVLGFVIWMAYRAVEIAKEDPTPEDFVGKPMFNLFVSVSVDVVGTVFSALPLVGQMAGLLWGPATSVLIYKLYGDRMMSGVGLVEEMLPVPFLSSVPSCSLAWLRTYWRIPLHFVYYTMKNDAHNRPTHVPETIIAKQM